MAKYKPTDPSAPGTTIGGAQYVKLPINIWTTQKHPVNLGSKSAKYIQMNNLVVELDGQFNVLPLAEKNSWNAAAAAYITVPVCGCKNVVYTGKKLHRVCNMGRYLLLLTYTPLPPSAGDPLGNSIDEFQYLFSGPIRQLLEVTPDVEFYSMYLICNTGLGLASPVIDMTAGLSTYVYIAGDPLFEQLIEIPQNGPVNWCLFSPDGMPINSGVFPLEFN